MRTFHSDLNSILATPKRRFFWMLHQVERLNAYEDQRQLRLLSTVQNPEGIVASSEALDKVIGTIYEWGQYIPPKFEMNNAEGLDPDFDRTGLRALKAKHGA